MEHAVGKLRHFGDLGRPSGGKRRPVGLLPAGFAHRRERHILRLHRPNEADPALDLQTVLDKIINWDFVAQNLDGEGISRADQQGAKATA